MLVVSVQTDYDVATNLKFVRPEGNHLPSK